MTEKENNIEATPNTPGSTLSPSQQRLSKVWEDHMKCEFETKNVDDTMATMIEGGHVNHVPTMTGGQGLVAIRDFYTRFFIPQMPPDTKTTPISRTIGQTQIVDEMIFDRADGLDATRHCAHGQTCRGGVGGYYRISGRQGFARAHLLGSSFRTGSVGTAGCKPVASGGSRERCQSARCQPAIEPSHRARRRQNPPEKLTTAKSGHERTRAPTLRLPLRAEADRAGGVESLASAPSLHRSTIMSETKKLALRR